MNTSEDDPFQNTEASINRLGVIKLNIENNLIEDIDYQEQCAVEFHRLFPNNTKNLCLLVLPEKTVEYSYFIYGNKGFKSTGKCHGNQLHSFIYRTDEIYNIVIQAYLLGSDTAVEFIRFININHDNVSEKITKLPKVVEDSPKRTFGVVDRTTELFKEETKELDNKNLSAFAKLQALEMTEKKKTVSEANKKDKSTQRLITGYYNQFTGRKSYTVYSDDEFDEGTKSNDDDVEEQTKSSKDNRVRFFYDQYERFGKEIDLLDDDVFNNDPAKNDSKTLEVVSIIDEEEDALPVKCLFQDYQKPVNTIEPLNTNIEA